MSLPPPPYNKVKSLIGVVHAQLESPSIRDAIAFRASTTPDASAPGAGAMGAGAVGICRNGGGTGGGGGYIGSPGGSGSKIGGKPAPN
ncbi:MAG: hypothetical protein ACYCOU_17670 [Sulfobacillus sp.]